MKTHNINPHSGDNNPRGVQVYKRAMRGIQEVVNEGPSNPNKPMPIVMKSKRVRAPQPPREAKLARAFTAKDLKE